MPDHQTSGWPVSRRPGSINMGVHVIRRGVGGARHALVPLSGELEPFDALCEQIAHWSLEQGLYSQAQRKRRRARRAATGGTL